MKYDLNIEILMQMIPTEALGIYNSNGSNNVNDALKESGKTWEEYQSATREIIIYTKEKWHMEYLTNL